MKKAIPVLITIFFSLVYITGCGRSPRMENTTALFKDYVYLEDSLTMVMLFPNKSFQSYYEKFRQDHGWDGDASKIKDGIYESYSTIDLRGYVHYVRLTVSKGAFTSVHYNEFKPGDGFGKRTDVKYGRSISMVKPTILADAYPALEADLLRAQNPVDVDTISGATLSSYRFQILLLKALYEASSGHILNTEKYLEGPALAAQ